MYMFIKKSIRRGSFFTVHPQTLACDFIIHGIG